MYSDRTAAFIVGYIKGSSFPDVFILTFININFILSSWTTTNGWASIQFYKPTNTGKTTFVVF